MGKNNCLSTYTEYGHPVKLHTDEEARLLIGVSVYFHSPRVSDEVMTTGRAGGMHCPLRA